MLANNSTAAAVAWIKKYLVVASTARGWWCWAIRGKMARVLISRPIQARSQCELINVRVVPMPSASSRVVSVIAVISRRRILTNMFGVWARELRIS